MTYVILWVCAVSVIPLVTKTLIFYFKMIEYILFSYIALHYDGVEVFKVLWMYLKRI